MRNDPPGAGGAATRSRAPYPWAAAAVLLFVASLAMRYPGVVMYDSVWQYQQALDGDYYDWHPPILARTWALLNHIAPGTGPFFLVQMLLWWGGLGLIATALGRRGRHGAAACVLLVGIAPLWLGWATIILKDAQMACCLVGAAGLYAHWRLADRRIPAAAVAAILLLLGYATLVRANAAFATIPFALAVFDRPRRARGAARAGVALLLILLVLIASPVINHRLLGAARTGVERTLPLYDLAGMAHFGAPAQVGPFGPRQWAAADRRGCYTPYFWNPYGEARQCGAIADAIDEDAALPLHRIWLAQVARHPLAYAAHRLAHLNANLRFWVATGEPDAVPQRRSEPNDLGLGAPPNPAGLLLIAAAGLMAGSPFGWPVIWAGVALALLLTVKPRDGAQVRLGRALALSALCMSASYAVISIASDLRYHLWSMVAAALASILLVDAGAITRRRAVVAAACLAALIAAAVAARLGLAAPVAVPLPQH